MSQTYNMRDLGVANLLQVARPVSFSHGEAANWRHILADLGAAWDSPYCKVKLAVALKKAAFGLELLGPRDREFQTRLVKRTAEMRGIGDYLKLLNEARDELVLARVHASKARAGSGSILKVRRIAELVVRAGRSGAALTASDVYDLTSQELFPQPREQALRNIGRAMARCFSEHGDMVNPNVDILSLGFIRVQRVIVPRYPRAGFRHSTKMYRFDALDRPITGSDDEEPFSSGRQSEAGCTPGQDSEGKTVEAEGFDHHGVSVLTRAPLPSAEPGESCFLQEPGVVVISESADDIGMVHGLSA